MLAPVIWSTDYVNSASKQGKTTFSGPTPGQLRQFADDFV